MFSVNDALTLVPPEGSPHARFVTPYLDSFCGKWSFCACILLERDSSGKGEFRALAGSGIPCAPFLGAEAGTLREFLEECFRLFPKPHVHSIGQTKIHSAVSKLSNKEIGPHALYIPIMAKGLQFIVVCFAGSKIAQPISKQLYDDLMPAVELGSTISGSGRFEVQLRVMESYVKEIGHDIASAVQATIAKLKNVSRGFFEGPLAKKKVSEAEEEIRSIYRISESLGITVDPQYNVSATAAQFDLNAAVDEVLNLYRSEASERHIELRFEKPAGELKLLGDKRAIQSAVGHLLLNAIKYAKGSSYVLVKAFRNEDEMQVAVYDVGEPIEEDEVSRIWEFGFRGKRALELHVNGSGIGLYTVRKIVEAHFGHVGVVINPEARSKIRFFFTIPGEDSLKRILRQSSRTDFANVL